MTERPVSQTPVSDVLATAAGGNLAGIFERWIGTDRIAYLNLTHGDIEAPVIVSYDDFADRCARFAGGLLARGLQPTQRVGILADNSVDFATSYIGIAWAGLVTVPLNTRQPAANLAWVAEDAELALVVHDAANADLVPPDTPAIEFGSDDWSGLLRADPAAIATMRPDDVAVQMYTSGSTGRPKGVLLTHGGQLFSIDQYLNGVMPMDPDERLLVSAPMYHKNAQMQLKMALGLGGSVVLLRRFDVEDSLRAVAHHRVTAMTGVPTMFSLMFRRPDLLDSLDRSSVRRLSIGSAPMTQALFDQARSLFPEAVVTNGYGTTEVVAVFGGHPDGVPRPAISVGHPLAAIETRLVDPATGVDAVPDARGHRSGELWVRSPGLMSGYHGLPDVTAARVTGGWYHTGDVMEADDHNWHFFVGRVDDMFVCAGENIYPGDVEQMLERCPGVHQCCIVPVADELKGSLPVAFAVRDSAEAPIDEAGVKEWALANGPAYQHPRAVWFVDELPLAGTAKIDRNALVDQAATWWKDHPASRER
ncbi:MAG: class I adenylate-forming enzyme family protein [Actinomycetota bacterium]